MKIIQFILIFISTIIQAQNLVPNWSFETFTACPTASGDLPKATPWIPQTTNSSDYYNACAPPGYSVPFAGASFQYAKDGVAFAGIWISQWTQAGSGNNYREYLQVQLTDSLVNTNCYYVEFYANLHDKIRYATNNIAANLSKTQYSTTSTGFILNLPQHITRYGNPIIKDTAKWAQIAGIFSPSGGEKYITIGNFKNDLSTDTSFSYNYTYGAYYHIDAVSVFSINPGGILPWQYRDTTVAIGDSVYIGNTMGGTFMSNWYTYGGTFINSGSGIYVKPVATGTYVVQYTVCGVPRSDTLKVTVTGVGVNEFGFENSEFKVSPNPNSGIFNIEILNKELVVENIEIKIENVLGQEIRKYKLQSKKQRIDLEEIESGIYYLSLVSRGTTISVKKIIKQ